MPPSIHPLERELISLAPGHEKMIQSWAERLSGDQICQEPAGLPIPKWAFLAYLCDHLGFVAHGSNRHDLTELVAVDRDRGDLTEFGNAAQVFASPDALWAMWFAVLNRNTKRRWGTCNACTRLETDEGKTIKSYWFSVPHDIILNEEPLKNGAVYLLRPEPFLDKNGEEWGSKETVRPLARIDIEPADWPFNAAVLGYDRDRLGDRLAKSPAGFPWFEDNHLWRIIPDAYRRPTIDNYTIKRLDH